MSASFITPSGSFFIFRSDDRATGRVRDVLGLDIGVAKEKWPATFPIWGFPFLTSPLLQYLY